MKKTTKNQPRVGGSEATPRSRATASKPEPSRPKNAYELLARVCEAIKAHPLAYYQGSWVLSDRQRIQDYCEFTPEQMQESCGTAYCRAGWIVALHDGRQAVSDLGKKDVQWPTAPVAERANAILGVVPLDTCDLYDGAACDVVNAKPGTRRYVAAGVRGLREFMKTHAAHLKARSLKGV